MNGATRATIQQLLQVDWFGSVGLPWSGESRVEVVASWDQAFTSCADPSWESLQLEAANRFSEKLLREAPARFQEWNEVVAAVRPTVDETVEKAVNRIGKNSLPPPAFRGSVEWDIMHLLIEAEFSDVCSPGFFASQGFWYVNGRFPCGWKGDFPDGTLVIY